MSRQDLFKKDSKTPNGRRMLIVLRNSLIEHMQFLGEVYQEADKRTRTAKEALAAHAEIWDEVNEINAALGIEGLAKLENKAARNVQHALASA